MEEDRDSNHDDQDLNPDPEVSYVIRKMDSYWNSAIDRKRILILCIPKRLDGNTPIEKLRNVKEKRTTVYYSLTYKQSGFMRRLLLDETLNLHCDFYVQEVLPPCGSYNQDRWLAAAAVYYILHTNLDRSVNNIKYQFLFDPQIKTLLTSCTIHQLQTMRPTVVEMIPSLENNTLFCLQDCTEDCNVTPFAGHFSLTGLQLLERDNDEPLENNLSRHNFNFPSGHPLTNLLFPNFHRQLTRSIEEKVMEAFESAASALPLKTYRVYILLIVTPNNNEAASLQNLLDLWQNEAATFEIYVGTTVEAEFREEHLSGSGRTGVSRSLREGSSLFLVRSQTFDTFEESRKVEAICIDICKVDNILALKKQCMPRFTLINIRSELQWMCSVEAETIRTYVRFVIGGNRLFRLPNEIFEPAPEYPFGNYPIQRQIDLTFFDDIDDENDNIPDPDENLNTDDEDEGTDTEESDNPDLEDEQGTDESEEDGEDENATEDDNSSTGSDDDTLSEGSEEEGSEEEGSEDEGSDEVTSSGGSNEEESDESSNEDSIIEGSEDEPQPEGSLSDE